MKKARAETRYPVFSSFSSRRRRQMTFESVPPIRSFDRELSQVSGKHWGHKPMHSEINQVACAIDTVVLLVQSARKDSGNKVIYENRCSVYQKLHKKVNVVASLVVVSHDLFLLLKRMLCKISV